MTGGTETFEHTCEPGEPGAVSECCACGQRDCPHGEPLHYHHDGCPVCSDENEVAYRELLSRAEDDAATLDAIRAVLGEDTGRLLVTSESDGTDFAESERPSTNKELIDDVRNVKERRDELLAEDHQALRDEIQRLSASVHKRDADWRAASRRLGELGGLALSLIRDVTEAKARARGVDLLLALCPEALAGLSPGQLEALRGRGEGSPPLLTELEGKALVAWAATVDPWKPDVSTPIALAARIRERRPHAAKAEGEKR